MSRQFSLNKNIFKSESTLLGRWPSEKASEEKKNRCYYCTLVLFLCLFKLSLQVQFLNRNYLRNKLQAFEAVGAVV